MSSGFSYPQPIFTSPIYNPAFYLTLDASGYLTYDYAQTLYLDKNDYRLTYITGITPGTATQGIALVPGTNIDISGIGALSCSSLTVNGSTVSSAPSYVVSITPGTAAINKALVLDGSGSIGTIASLTATNIYGTLQTAAQGNITSVGTLSSLTIDGNLVFSGASRTITGLSSISATTLTGALSTASQTAITSVGTLSGLTIGGNLVFSGASRSISGLSSISATTLTGAVSGSQTGITAVGTLSSLTVSGPINGTLATAAQPNITSLGNLSSLTATSITGTLQTASQPNITSLGNLSTLSATNIYGTIQTGAQPNITSLGNLSSLTATTISGSLTTAYQGAITTIGGLKYLVVAGTDESTAYNIGSAIIAGGLGVAKQVYIGANTSSTDQTHGSLVVGGDMGLGGTLNADSFRLYSGGVINQALADQTAWLTTRGNLTDWIDGGYSIAADFYGANITPVRGIIEISNGSSGTTTSSLFIGTYTSNDFRLGTANSTRMPIKDTGRVGIGTTTPGAILEVSGSVSQTIDAGGQGYGYFGRLSSTYSIGPVSAIAISIKSSNSILVASGGYYTTSDQRVKSNIKNIELDDTNKFMNIRPKSFAYKSCPEQEQFGYVAQDFIKKWFAICYRFIGES